MKSDIQTFTLDLDTTMIMVICSGYISKLIDPANDEYPELTNRNYEMLLKSLPKQWQEHLAQMMEMFKNNPQAAKQTIDNMEKNSMEFINKATSD